MWQQSNPRSSKDYSIVLARKEGGTNDERVLEYNIYFLSPCLHFEVSCSDIGMNGSFGANNADGAGYEKIEGERKVTGEWGAPLVGVCKIQ